LKQQKEGNEAKIMDRKKYHVFFRRVSTAGQDLAMQESADAPFREKLPPDEIIIINEDATSANKKSISERPGMQNVISLIKDGKVRTLYAFDRTRLFRDFFEGMEFNELRTTHDVEIFFTSVGNGNIPVSDSFFLEGILNLYSDIEGKNIARRTEEARKRYPPKKLGYIKNKETKKYKRDPSKQELISQYFASLLDLSTIEALGELLKEFKKKLKRNDIVLINLARDPFYAGYDLSIGENKLTHVEPYIDLEMFNRIQQTTGNLLQGYLDRMSQLEKQNIYEPLCGICNNLMRYRYDESENVGYYQCTRKHKKVFVDFNDLSNIVHAALNEIIMHLDSQSLWNHSVLYFRQLRKQIESEIKAIEPELFELKENIILDSKGNKDWKDHTQYSRLKRLEAEKCALLDELANKEALLTNNRSIVEEVKKYLTKRLTDNPSLLCTMFINKIKVYPDEVDLEAHLFDYLFDIQTDFVYTGGDVV
jgi:DNA invertase Pin-like site-specific DNA recombinase